MSDLNTQISSLNKEIDSLRQRIAELESAERLRIQAEEELFQAKKFTDRLIASANVIIICLDTEGHIVLCNETTERFTGYTKEELIGQNWLEIIVPKDRYPYVWEEFNRIKQSGIFLSTFENPILTKSGEERIISWNNSLIQDNQNLIATVSFGIDITEQKQTEEELNHYFDVSLDLLCIADTEGNFHRLNPEWERTLGYSLKELKEHRFLDFIHPSDLPATLDAIATLSGQKEVLNFTNRFRCKNGTYRWIEWRSYPKGRLIYASAHDITEQKQVEEALRDNEKKYHTLFESESDAIFLIDKETGHILEANTAASNLYGYDKEEILSRKNTDLSAEPDKTHNATTNELAKIPIRWHRKKDGTIFPVEISASHLMWHERQVHIAAIRDITERIRVEEELRKSQQLFMAFMDNLPAGVFIKDHQSRLLFANRYLNEIFAWNNCLKQTTEEILPEEIAKRMTEDDQKCLKEGLQVIEEQVIDSKGKERFFETHKFPIPNDRHPLLLGGIAVDITERKHAEKERQRLYKQTQRDASTKVELLKEVNHRVKNNLLAINGLLLSEKRHAPEDGRIFIEKTIDNLSHRIEGMLTIHQMLSDSHWEPLLLCELANRIIHSGLSILPENSNMVIDITPSPLFISPRQASNLAMVFNELTTNTVKYASIGQEPILITVQISKENNMITIEYHDNGPGYPPEVLNLQRHNVGIYILQQLITKTLRGSLTLSNREGALTTMRIKAEETNRT